MRFGLDYLKISTLFAKVNFYATFTRKLTNTDQRAGKRKYCFKNKTYLASKICLRFRNR